MLTMYTINCVIAGETIEFPIKIESSEPVHSLKKMIKEEMKNTFANIDAAHLDLYRVNISGSRNEKIEQLKKMAGDLDWEELIINPSDELTEIYSTAPPEKGAIHIIVQPPQTVSRKRKLSSSMTVSDPVVVSRRKLFTDSNVAPSSFGKPAVYAKLDPENYAFNRPPSPKTIPLALLHKIFGQFVENAQTRVPTAADNALVCELRQVLSVIYDTEATLCHEFRKTVEKHYEEIQFEPATIGSTSHQSDGHIRYKGFLYSVAEAKFLGKGAGDPEVQACGYFITSLKQLYVDNKGDFPDLFPCLIIYFTGPFVCFSGAVVTDRVHLETLTPTFSLHTNVHESEIALQAARAFGAFTLACGDLKAYYEKLAPKMESTNHPEARRLLFPYKDRYMARNGEPVKFDYLERLYTTKLIFAAKNSKGDELFIKFTRRYSAEAHQYCSDKGIAPKLYAVEALPGGWMMVVMEFLGDMAYTLPRSSKVETALLRAGLKAAVDILHQGNFVHGDIRDANVMVKTEWDTSGVGNVRLVDFDWAGEVDKAEYPPNVNFREIERPDGARDGQSISKEHDLEMLGYIFPVRVGS